MEGKEVEGKFFALDPQARLKKDRGRSIIFKLSDIMAIEYFQFIHPTVAMMLALFDGTKPLWQVTKELSLITKTTEEVARKELLRLLEGKLTDGKKWLIEVKTENKHLITRKYNPLPFIEKPATNISDPRMSSPAFLNFLLTYRCSANCIYCYSEAGSIPPPFEIHIGKVKELIEEAKEMQVILIYLGGGDPFCNPNVYEVLRLVIEAGIIPFVSTKTILSDSQMGRLKDSGLERIQVSIDTLDADTAKFLIGLEEYPDRMMKAITKLIHKGIKVSTNTVVTPYNLKDIPHLVERLVHLGVYHIGITPYGRSHYRHRESLFLSEEEKEWLSEQVGRLQSRYPNVKISFQDARELCNPTQLDLERRRELWSNRSICSVGRHGLLIFPDGKVGICEELPYRPEYWLGDLLRNSIAEIWNSQEIEDKILYPKRDKFRGWPCYECEDFEVCNRENGRCLRDALKVYNTIYAPPPLCPKAPYTTKRLC